MTSWQYLCVFKAHQSNRVCNALALMQCVASHSETRSVFLQGSFILQSLIVYSPIVSLMTISAHIPLFLYPFLHTTSKTRPFEYLRLTSLGVIGALVKVNISAPIVSSKILCFHVLQTDEQEVINFLLTTEIIPLCLRIMESGSELSKTVSLYIPSVPFYLWASEVISRRIAFQVATFILQKILLDETGLSYICQTYDRFSHVAMILVRITLWLN